MARDGPGSLGTGKAGQVEVTEEQAEEVGKFWRGVWGQTGSYHPEHTALKLWTAKVGKDRKDRRREGVVPEMLDRDEAWESAVAKQPSWKAPGPDNIAAFWYKAYKEPTALLRKLIWNAVDGDDEMPGWLVEGRTVMIPKEGCKGEPEGFRPIA